MKTQNNTTLTFIAPKVKTVTITTRSHILQSSITGYLEDGSKNDNDGYGYNME